MKNESLTHVRNIVAFCALMQNNGGIIDKSPDYIIEKFNRFCMSKKDETPWGLDSGRKSIVNKWLKKWYGMDKTMARIKTPEEEKYT